MLEYSDNPTRNALAKAILATTRAAFILCLCVLAAALAAHHLGPR